MKHKKIYFVLSIVLLVSLPVQACTLWAANGSVVEGGGSLIIKNRDWVPDHKQTVKLVSTASGYRYFGIFARGEYSGLKAGINEKGLVIINASASSIPVKERMAMYYQPEILERLLNECADVDGVLSSSDLFQGPQFIIIADKDKIATIEIGSDGVFAREFDTCLSKKCP